MTRKEMRAAAYEKLMEATKLLTSAGLPLLAEEVEELALQVDLQATDSGRKTRAPELGPLAVSTPLTRICVGRITSTHIPNVCGKACAGFNPPPSAKAKQRAPGQWGPSHFAPKYAAWATTPLHITRY